MAGTARPEQMQVQDGKTLQHQKEMRVRVRDGETLQQQESASLAVLPCFYFSTSGIQTSSDSALQGSLLQMIFPSIEDFASRYHPGVGKQDLCGSEQSYCM